MLDLRRTAAPLRAARVAALAAALTLSFMLLAVSGAHAASGQLAAFGLPGDGSGNTFNNAGVVAVDSSDGNAIYVADNDENGAPRLRKYDSSGTLLGTAAVPNANAAGLPGLVVALAVDADPAHHRVYALLASKRSPDTAANHRNIYASMDIVAFSPTPDAGRSLALSSDNGYANGVVYDFRTGGHWVDDPTAIAVDPTTHQVAILGVVDPSQSPAVGVIQYVTERGVLGATVSPLGNGVDPNTTLGADTNTETIMTGMAIGPDGKVYIPVATSGADPSANGLNVYRLPQGGAGAAQLVAHDPTANRPLDQPSLGPGFASGVPIAVSPDGSTVWVDEGDNGTGGFVRGFATDGSGDQLQVYGGGTTDTTQCFIPNRLPAMGLAAGSGGAIVVTSPNSDGSVATDRAVYVFGSNGADCPQPQGLFTVDGRGDGNVTVNKGQAIQMDASASDLRGGSAGEVDWDWGNGTTDQLNGADALRPKHTFTATGTFRVGVKIHIQGGVVTEEVFHTVTVVAPKPTAAFTSSTRTPAAGGTVTFDATNSIDPGRPAADAHRLRAYRWDFGDGSAAAQTTTPTIAHTFANGGSASLSRTVKLVVVSGDDVSSDAFAQTITVGGTPTQQPPATTGTTPAPPARTQTTPPGGGGRTTITFPAPSLGAASVDRRGTASFTVRCPSGGNPCTGTITLTTKVTKKVRGRKKVTTVKLGTVSFSVAAGKGKAVRVRLSATGRSLLRKARKLAAAAAIRLTVSGQSQSTSRTLTLKASSAKKH